MNCKIIALIALASVVLQNLCAATMTRAEHIAFAQEREAGYLSKLSHKRERLISKLIAKDIEDLYLNKKSSRTVAYRLPAIATENPTLEIDVDTTAPDVEDGIIDVEPQMPMVAMAEVADAPIKTEFIPAPVRAYRLPATTTENIEIDVDTTAPDVEDGMLDVEPQMPMVAMAEVADAPIKTESIPAPVRAQRHKATVNAAEIEDAAIATEFIAPELPEDVRAYDKAVAQQMWDEHEARAIYGQEMRAIIAAEREKIQQQKVAKPSSSKFSATFNYYWDQYRSLYNNQQTRTALRFGLGLMLLYGAYKGGSWLYTKIKKMNSNPAARKKKRRKKKAYPNLYHVEQPAR